jgi:hypothetical protein
MKTLPTWVTWMGPWGYKIKSIHKQHINGEIHVSNVFQRKVCYQLLTLATKLVHDLWETS